MPEEFLSLADWSESQGYVEHLTAFLGDPEVYLMQEVPLFGLDRYPPYPDGYLPDPDRYQPIGSTGGDGSDLALWLDDDGVQRVVHHGSGSGSTLWATFPSALSVLRLFAVGYYNPCSNDEWGDRPERDDEEEEEISDAALAPYRAWLQQRWGQDTPKTGVEALCLSNDEAEVWTRIAGPTTGDPFNEWLTSGNQ